METNDELKSEKDNAILSQGELYNDACSLIERAQASAYRSVNDILIKRNWLLGLRIQREVLKEQRAEYGEQVIMKLSKELTEKYGRGFKKSNLYLFMSFYQNHPDFFQLPIGKSLDMADEDIFQSLTGKSPIRLSWTHYSIILQETTADGRVWYEKEATAEMWDTRTLQRNVSSQYYHRLLKSQDKDVGQMDMYVKMYDDLVRPDGHNPTIGILLCSDTDEDVAHYSVLNNNDQLFAAKYLTYMPTQEELRREIEQQKEFYKLQNVQ